MKFGAYGNVARLSACFGLCLGAGIAVVGCGGATPQATAVPTGAAASAERVAAQAPPDVSPVPEPASLALVGRIASPQKTMEMLAKWAPQWARGIDSVTGAELAELMVGARVGAIVDLTQPVDFAALGSVSQEGAKGSYALSAAVLDVAAARQALMASPLHVVSDHGGVLVVSDDERKKAGKGGKRPAAARDEKGDDADEADEDDDMPRSRRARTCVLLPAAVAGAGGAVAGAGGAVAGAGGAVAGGTRLVCGQGEQVAGALAPYLARTVTRTAPTSAMHVELRFTPVQGFLEENRRLLPGLVTGLVSRASNGAGIRDAAVALVEELVDLALDLDRMTLDLRLTADGADLSMATRYRSTNSLVARSSLQRAGHADVAPPAFLRLPADSEIALYGRGADDKEFEHARQLLAAAVVDALAEGGLAAADARPVAEGLAAFLGSPPMVYAHGVDMAAAEAALQSLVKVESASGGAPTAAAGTAHASVKSTPQLSREAVTAALVGWHLAGIEDNGRALGALRALAAVWNRPSVQKLVASKSGGPPVTIKSVKPSAKDALPPGAVVYELSVPAQAKANASKMQASMAPGLHAPLSSVVHVAAVAEGTRTWFSIALDKKLAFDHLRGVLPGAPATGTLSARKGIEAVRDERAVSAGFLSVEGGTTLALLAGSVDEASATRARGAIAALSMARSHGQTLVRIGSQVDRAADAGGTTTTSIHLPRAVVDESMGILAATMAAQH